MKKRWVSIPCPLCGGREPVDADALGLDECDLCPMCDGGGGCAVRATREEAEELRKQGRLIDSEWDEAAPIMKGSLYFEEELRGR